MLVCHCDAVRIAKKEKKWLEIDQTNIETNQKAYNQLMDKFIPRMAGEEQARKMSSTKNPAEWLTVAQIAFVLLTIENYEEITD